jgi:heat shock protein HslJ
MGDFMNAFRLALLIAALGAATAADAQSHRRGNQEQRPQDKGEAPAPRIDKVFPTKASWVAISLNGKPFSGDRPSFVLDEQFRMRGFSGCNTFSATAYPLRQQGLAVGPFALTKKACDTGLMASERAFLTALRGAARWDSDGKELVVKGTAGELKFERVL